MLDNVEFYFIHIPKTAGDSFRDALGCAFNFQDILRVNYYANGFRIENDVKEPKLINGHIPMSKLRLLDPDYKLSLIHI